MSRRTPTTPFIPPMGTPRASPQPSPVIPTSGGSPNWNPQPPGPGGYPVYPAHSAYVNTTPFIPHMSPGVTPGVVPASLPPQRPLDLQGVSSDYTGYPQLNNSPYNPPQTMGIGPQTIPPPAHGPYTSQPTSPWHSTMNTPFPAFNSTPWPTSAPPLPGPPVGTPWGAPSQRLPPQGPPPFGAYTPGFVGHMNIGAPPAAWPGATQQQQPQQFYQQQGPSGDPWGHFGGIGGPIQQPPPPPRAPQGHIHHDRMPPFTEGKHYGPVLDPFLLRILQVQIKINPLLAPLPEDGSDQIHLNWNMVFPSSTVQRSDDPRHLSWSKGRGAPATFPRVKELRLVSELTPWLITIRAKDESVGVTCGEIIEGIAHDMGKQAGREDYQCLPKPDQSAVTNSYHYHRSPRPTVPGGALGQGMKRLDFLRRSTTFAGIVVDDRIVRRLCGSTLPCVFILKSSPTFQMTEREAKDQEARAKAAAAASSSKSRSRAGSFNARISVRPPSSIGSDDSNEADDGSIDR